VQEQRSWDGPSGLGFVPLCAAVDKVGPHRPWRTYGQCATLRCPALARRCARALRRHARFQRAHDRRRSRGRVARRRARRRRRRAGTRRRRLHRRHPRAAPELKLARIRPRAPPRPDGGKRAAVRTGLGLASGRYATVLDADLKHRAEAIRDLLAPVAPGEADAAFGIGGFRAHSAYSFWYVAGNRSVALTASPLFN
jgi:hypothetical protein